MSASGASGPLVYYILGVNLGCFFARNRFREDVKVKFNSLCIQIGKI